MTILKRNSSFFFKLFLISFSLFLFSFTYASASTYYVSNTGLDTNNGISESTPWQSISKINATTFSPGDSILFKKGDTFYGSITVSQSGTVGNPITFSSYGTSNEKPVITGFTTISGWTDEGGGIYSKVITSESQTNMVTIDGVQYGMGRYPNSEFLTYESASGYASITDNQLTASPNWTGAEAVIYKNGYRIERDLITSHSSGTLNYTIVSGSNMNAEAPNKYFIQNDLKTLDQFGEWYHDYSGTGKLYMYFGAISPASNTIKVATLNNLFTVSTGKTYITLDGLSFVGSIKQIFIAQYNCHYLTIQNVDFSFAGSDGVYIDGQNATITESTFNHSNRISIITVGVNATITNNSISNNAVILGQGFGWTGTSAIVVVRDNATITGNNIQNTGTNGIFIDGTVDTGLVKNNYIYNTCIHNWDHGAIYTSQYYTALVIEDNIIEKSGGNGIYLDAAGGFITAKNNSVTDCALAGLFLHEQSNDSVYNNTVFNCKYGILVSNTSTANNSHDVVLTNNISVAKTVAQVPLSYYSAYSGYASSFPTYSFSGNVYARPIDDVNAIYYNGFGTGGYKSLSQWQTFSSQDTNSKKSPISITSESDIFFDYNATTSNKTVSLPWPVVDMDGNKVTGNVTILPYRSVIYLKDPSPNTVDSLPPSISSFTIPTTSTSLAISITTLSATDSTGVTGYLLNETGSTPSAGSGPWSSTPPTSYTFTTQGTKTLYAFAKDLAGNVSLSSSDTITITLPVVTPPAGGGGGGGAPSTTTITCPTGTTLVNTTCVTNTTTSATLIDKAKQKDIKPDGSINIIDFNIIMANWNKTYTKDISLTKGDITGDGLINIFDMNQLMVMWGVRY